MNVLTAAWADAGAPASDDAAGLVRGRCARCSLEAGLTPVREVVSKAFTSFDDWADTSGRGGLCATCAWGYTTPALRAVPHLVTRDPAQMRELTRTAAGELLAGGALAAGLALVVPLRPGRKHILPAAAWGRVSVDDAQLPWTDHDAELLRAVVRLRALGFGPRMLTEPAPAYPVMADLKPTRWTDVMADWNLLTPWRAAAAPWMPLALHLTTPMKEEAR